MNKEQRMVYEFHQAFDAFSSTTPCIPSLATRELRRKLIQEELDELSEAMLEGSIIKTADAIADLLYVVHGTAVSFGLDMEPIFAEVHRSNMTKVGGEKRADGKILKPPSYTPPNLQPIIEAQYSSKYKLPPCSICGSRLIRYGWYERREEPVVYGYCLSCDIAGREPCIQVCDKTLCEEIL